MCEVKMRYIQRGDLFLYLKLEIKLQRVIAKLSVKFDLSTEICENGNPTGEYVNFESMELLRIPKYSYLVADKYKLEDGFLE